MPTSPGWCPPSRTWRIGAVFPEHYIRFASDSLAAPAAVLVGDMGDGEGESERVRTTFGTRRSARCRGKAVGEIWIGSANAERFLLSTSTTVTVSRFIRPVA